MNLRELRELAGLNQEALGELTGVTRQTIAAWEKGDREPSMQQMTKLCRILNVPIEVMLGMAEQANEPVLLFRADAADTLSPALKQLLTRKAFDYGEIERLAGALPNLPGSRPMATFDEHIVEQVANEVRDWLGVEDAPLGDVLSLLEGKGLKIFLYKLPNAVSGFSAYTDEIGGAIFVNADHRTERQYFTALHELSHLIFHRKEYQGLATTTKTGRSDPREQAANHLAGAVLLPRTIVEAELHPYRNRWLPFSLLADIKQRYSVSMRTILVRAGQLGIITQRQAFQQIAKINAKYGKEDEPVNLKRPESLRRLNRLVYQALIEEKITTSRAAEVLGEPVYSVKEELGRWLSEEIG
jgi:Zn-dependent peptidase ImmA (M78 family)/DNA-binding XRE family transcriptional regulator